MVRKKLGRGRKNRCRFCTKEGCPRPAFVDYKDVQGLKKLCTSQGKLFSRKRSGNCRRFPASRRHRPEAGPLHGAAALRRRVEKHLTPRPFPQREWGENSRRPFESQPLPRAYALKVAQISSRLLGWAKRPCFSANLVDVPERPRTRALIAEANTGLS